MAAKHAVDQKFASTIKNIEKARMCNIERASQDTEEAMRFAHAVDKEWLLELTAAAAGSGGGKDSSWRTGAAALIAVLFSAMLQRTGVHAGVSVNRADVVKSVELF